MYAATGNSSILVEIHASELQAVVRVTVLWPLRLKVKEALIK